MCTISWLVGDASYSVFFNRDESKARPIAFPPAIYSLSKQKAIMPLDPEGEGSWIAVNASGFTFALLNFYQGRLPKGRLRSRGKIVKELADCSSLEEVETWFRQVDLARYAPFSLLVFYPGLTREPGPTASIPLYRWNGKILVRESKQSPHFSSAINFEEVCRLRERIYAASIGHKIKPEVEDFRELHKSHQPAKSSESICMHRELAHTVSFSQVSVNHSEVCFFYADGAPCEVALQKPVRLARQTVGND